MNKHEFIDELAKTEKLSRFEVEEIFHTVANIVAEKLCQGETVEVPYLGKFKFTTRKRAEYKNLFGTTKEITKDECVYPSFQIAHRLKDVVRSGRKLNCEQSVNKLVEDII
ncbi:MAG: HU family DNA-binding protein [Clostridiales bacterium]|nr:HU family DNA-binding protein [Clostridiales bacterium]